MNVKYIVNKRTRENVIDIILKSPGMNIRNIWFVLGTEKITYHAVYKVVKNLEKEKIIVNKNGGFELSSGWINSLKSITKTFERTRKKENTEKVLNEIEEKSTPSDSYFLKFKSRMELEKFILKCSEEFNEDVVSISDHIWYYLIFNREYRAIMQKKKIRVAMIANCDTKIDKEGQRFYTSIGMSTAVGARTGIPDMIVIGNYIFYTYIKEDKISEILGEEGKSLEINDLYKILDEKMDCHLIVVKSPPAAEIIRKRSDEILKRGIKYISFDLGNTLVDDNFDEMIWRYEIPRIYSKKNGIKFEDAYEFVISEYKKLYGRVPNWRSLDFWVKHFKLNKTANQILDKYKNKIRAFDETNEVLERLSKRHKIVLITMSDKAFFKKRMEVLGIDKYFSKIFLIYDKYKIENKNEEIYSKVLKDLNISASQMVHIGNDYELDYLIPSKLGIKSIIIDRNFEKSGPNVIHSLLELEKILSNTFQ